MAEKDVQKEIFRWVDFERIPNFERIPDIPWMILRNGGTAFQFLRPYDFYWFKDGLFHAIELKQCKTLSWNFKFLRDHQEAKLISVHNEKNGLGWVLINFRLQFSKRASKKYGAESIDRTFGVTIEQIEELKIIHCVDKISLDWILENGVEVKKIILPLEHKKPHLRIAWDLMPLHKAGKKIARQKAKKVKNNA